MDRFSYYIVKLKKIGAIFNIALYHQLTGTADGIQLLITNNTNSFYLMKDLICWRASANPLDKLVLVC